MNRIARLTLYVALVIFPVWANARGDEFDAPECAHTNDSDVPTNHMNRGLCHVSRNYLSYAKSEFQFVINLQNEKETYLRPAAYLNLGVVYLMESNYALATRNFLSAIEAKPDYAEAYFNLGVVYYKQKVFKKAEEAYLKAIELQPDYGRAHYSLGFLYLEERKYDLAKRHAELAVENGVPFKTLQERLAKVSSK